MIEASCPQCHCSYKLKPEFAGRTVRCRKCQTSFQAPSSRDLRADKSSTRTDRRSSQRSQAAGPSGDPWDDLDDRTESGELPSKRRSKASGGVTARRSHSKVAKSTSGFRQWMLGGAAGALLLTGLLIFFRGRSAPSSPSEPTPTIPIQTPQPVVRGAETDGNDSAPQPAPSTWQVQSDPSPDLFQWSDTPPELTARFQGFMVPATASPFVFLGRELKGSGKVVVNLATGENVARIQTSEFDPGRADAAALSPDGRHVALVDDNAVEVWSLEAGENQSLGAAGEQVHFVEFGPPGTLVTVEKYGKLVVRNIGDGEILHAIDVPADRTLGHWAYAISPGRKYLAVDHRPTSGVGIYDLVAGRLAGEVPARDESGRELTITGLEFSPDGTRLGILAENYGEDLVLVVDLPSGDVRVAAREFTGRGGHHNAGAKWSAHILQWLPEDRGWLVKSELVLDAISGRSVWRDNPDRFRRSIRLPAPNGLWSVKQEYKESGINFIPLPWKAIRDYQSRVDTPDNLIRTGSSVSLDIRIGEVRFAQAEEVRQELTAALNEALQTRGLMLSEQSPLALRIDYSESSGGIVEYGASPFPTPNQPGQKVDSTNCDCTVQLISSAGTPLFQCGVRTAYAPGTIRGAVTPETVRKEALKSAFQWMKSVPLPYYIAERPGEQLPLVNPDMPEQE
ncbi:MAG: hypothetical protein KDA75_07140 [Planctomycetaceae bacterium]|nr:hypothetical protein [Planctomycetaceae bacterium]